MGSAAARSGKRLVVGPWAHSTGTRFALVNGRAGGAPPNPMDFGDNAVIDLNMVYLRWFDHWLKGIDNGVGKDAPVQIFVMGENRWRDENAWPLARTKYTNYYIHGSGRANSADGDGVLSPEPPEAGGGTDSFSYDPADPVPSMGGNVCCSDVPAGPWDQRSVERRDDVLVYTTPEMKESMEITARFRYQCLSRPDVFRLGSGEAEGIRPGYFSSAGLKSFSLRSSSRSFVSFSCSMV